MNYLRVPGEPIDLFRATISRWLSIIRDEGFQRRGLLWFRPGLSVLPLVEVQRFGKETGGRSIEFTINWSVFVPEFASWAFPDSPTSPSMSRSPFSARVVVDPPPNDVWWRVTNDRVIRVGAGEEEADEKEVRSALVSDVLPRLRDVTRPVDVAQLLLDVEREGKGHRSHHAARGDTVDFLTSLDSTSHYIFPVVADARRRIKRVDVVESPKPSWWTKPNRASASRILGSLNPVAKGDDIDKNETSIDAQLFPETLSTSLALIMIGLGRVSRLLEVRFDEVAARALQEEWSAGSSVEAIVVEELCAADPRHRARLKKELERLAVSEGRTLECIRAAVRLLHRVIRIEAAESGLPDQTVILSYLDDAYRVFRH